MGAHTKEKRMRKAMNDYMSMMERKRQIVKDSIAYGVDTEDNDIYSWNFECNHVTNPELVYVYKLMYDKVNEIVIGFSMNLKK